MIIELPIPQARDELSLHRVGSWEEASIQSHSSRVKQIEVPDHSLCDHAVSFGSCVYGIRSTVNDNKVWVAWKQSFAPYRVCRVTSNQDGSVIVCSTDAETVALIRGSDGAVIATRKVSNEEESTTNHVPYCSFVGRSPLSTSQNKTDAVLVGILSPHAKADFLLVSNINAEQLNHKDHTKASEAARKMAINSSLKIPNGKDNYITSACGCFLDDSRIRFFSLDNKGTISCLDYRGPEVPLQTVEENLPWNGGNGKNATMNLSIGLRLHELNKTATFVMFATDSKLLFLDPYHLSIVGSCDISSISDGQNAKILAIEPIESASPESGLAVAIALSNQKEGIICVVETAVEDKKLGSFHQVYKVPILGPVESISLAPIQSYPKVECYSFRFKVWRVSQETSFKAFNAGNKNHDGSAIGKIRLLIQLECFDEADLLINNIGESLLISDEYANFHPSEVALGRLQHILKLGNVSQKGSMAQAQQCFHRLSSGCISGNKRAGENLLNAADSISEWASPGSSQNPPTLVEVIAALATVSRVIGEILKMLPSEGRALFEEKRLQLEDQLSTLRYLSSVLPNDPKERQQFARRFQGARSPGDLFVSLVGGGCFSAAEGLWNSQLRKMIQPKDVVKAVVAIGSNADPNDYVGMLEDLILPSLSMNFQFLPPLWLWCCRTAEKMDDNGDLQKAIDLLQSMERATNNLQLRIHSSFATHSPFVSRPPTSRKKKAIASRNASNADSSFASLGLKTPQRNDALQFAPDDSDATFVFPTVLELGHIKRGAMKSRTAPTARGVDTAETPNTTDSHVRQKLLEARCLKAARGLGLRKGVAVLKTFSNFGGTQNFAREVVSCLSTMAGTHEERQNTFQNEFIPFCKEFNIDFDESMLQYLKGLCASTTATPLSIEESASVARCCKSVVTKCQCILIVLRAALFCRYSPPWLQSLSQDAIEWSSADLSLRSELVEASRLLLIDRIVRNYVGSQGCDLFRVDNPRHALRLLDYVTHHYDRESVLHDALDLADAFNHLSRLEACAALCSQAISGSRVELCSDFVEELYGLDPLLADSACVRIVSFCFELVTECTNGIRLRQTSIQGDNLRKSAMNGSSAACAILSIVFAQSRTTAIETLSMNAYSKVDMPRLESLKADFLAINELQRNHAVFLSFNDLRCTATLLNTAAQLMSPVVDAYISLDWKEWNIKLALAKRACSLLAGACECQEIEFWCAAVSIVASPLKWNYDDGLCIDFLVDVGVLGGFRASNSISARTALSVAFFLCLKASRGDRSGFNENIGRSVSLVNDYCLATCGENLLLQCESLSTLADMVWQVLLRGDEGVGEKLETLRSSLLVKSWSTQFQVGGVNRDDPSSKRETEVEPSPIRVPALHPSWYIGDGILLPPNESISRSVKFCEDVMNALTVSSRRFAPLASGGISEITRFLFNRGALSVALRVLSCSSVLLLSSGVPQYGSLASAIQEVFTASVERSLGGTGNGFVSQIVDSHHAVSFLLSLPVKLAFKVYKSAVPAALSTRDYSRLIALANVGIKAGSGQRGNKVASTLPPGWKNQEKLISQCKSMSNQAVWWRFLRKHRISFDQKLLVESKGRDGYKQPYPQTLLDSIIIRLLSMTNKRSNSPVNDILQVLLRYAMTFGLSSAQTVEAFIKFLLSSPEENVSSDDARLNLPQVELSVRELLPLLKSKEQRPLIMRRCVVALESNEHSAKDYDRHALLLSLYRESLHNFRAMHVNGDKFDQQLLEAELEAIDRRCDALAILSSVFQGTDRPPFPSFFRPLPPDFGLYKDVTPVLCCGVLGKDESSDGKAFDPLEPLNGLLLRRSFDMNTSTVLAPLCIPLGLPSGYIHARFLMEHFRLSAKENSTMPSFEHDVMPVCSRLQASGDKAALAEWCSSHFVSSDQERLRCLEFAHICAVKHSNEAEQRKIRYSRNSKEPGPLALLSQEEGNALKAVRRLEKAKSSLADKIKVVTALKKDRALAYISKDLIHQLDLNLWQAHDEVPQPERVVEVLLAEASLIAANHCLNGVPLSMPLFRQLSALVNNGCQALADAHSHIHVGHTAWSMVERWLFQGDTVNADSEKLAEPKKPSLVVKTPGKLLALEEYKEEDTINFVMDLSALQEEEHVWCDEDRKEALKEENRITSDEERSALRRSEREEAELMTVRTALRVAFVLACHDNVNTTDEDKENTRGPGSPVRSSGKGRTGGLLARIEKRGEKQNTLLVMTCAKNLLKIVFAKPELQSESRFQSTTVTFSMRHRALRSAAVLVPQEALEKVIEDEGYLDAGGTPSCTLNMCTFGAFVANECEQIGMPLAHSDLGHISSMHFSSYARTLWRHHRDGDQKGSKGRLLLLLLQMSLKDVTNIDSAFVELLFKEMSRLNLPRSQLLACECIAALREEIGATKYDSLLSACGGTVNAAIAASARAVLKEVRDFSKADSQEEDRLNVIADVTSTVGRLGQVVQRFSESDEGQCQLCQFVEVLADTKKLLSANGHFSEELSQALANALRYVKDPEFKIRHSSK